MAARPSATSAPTSPGRGSREAFDLRAVHGGGFVRGIFSFLGSCDGRLGFEWPGMGGRMELAGGEAVSTTHGIALGILIAIGLLSVVGFIQLLMLPFDIAARLLFGAADAQLKAKEAERICKLRMRADMAIASARRGDAPEVP
jgi:hypothetical protein